MKRAKRIVIIILILSLTIFGVVKSAISVSDSDFDQYSDFAETGGSKETALKKILSAPLASCINETFGWNDKFWSMTTLNFNSSDVQGGQWFADFWSTTGSGNTDVVKSGAYVEKLTTGEYSDGKIYCGEKDNALLSNATSVLGISMMDLACDYRDGQQTSGVFYVDPTVTTCNQNSDVYKLNTERLSYYETAVTNLAFNGSIPAGSLYSLTPAEQYWVNRLNFEAGCASGTPVYGNTTLAYQVISYNESTGRFEQAGYGQQNSPSTTIYTFNAATATCQELANSLTLDDPNTVAYIKSTQKPSIDSCRSTFDEKNAATLTVLNEYKNIAAEYPACKKVNNEWGLYTTSTNRVEGPFDNEIDCLNANMTRRGESTTYSTSQRQQVQTQIVDPLQAFYDGKLAMDKDANGEVWALASLIGEVTCPGSDNYNNGMPDVEGLAAAIAGVQDYEYGGPDTGDEQDAGTVDTCTEATSDECREKACYQAAGSLGWVICPAIFTVRDAVNGIYSGVIEPLLMVDASVIASIGSNSSPTYQIWATFRNIANILFAIVLLAVIFSQVTGFGIDNYGIKKILPKLIVTAILVNLSLIICGLLVDVSNALGGGIKQLFDTMAGNVDVDWLTEFVGDSDPSLSRVNVIGTVLSYVLGLLVVGGGAATVAGVYTGGIALSSLIIPLLLLVLSGVIAAFFAFVILGARQALIIIMIVLSPLAFVLYALPNTQGIFKKWFKIFEGLLLVYPAASIMVGGGYLASRLILSNISANPFMAMIAGLVSIVPYFMIPKLTSKSMDAIGGIGNAINGISRGSRSRATNGINNSEAVKRRRQAGIDAAHARNANRYLNSRRGQRDLQAVRDGNGSNLSRARRARLATALQNSNSDYETNKGILDSAQLRDNVASGNQTAVDAYNRSKGSLDLVNQANNIGNQTLMDEFNREQSSFDLAHAVGERDASRASAELKRYSEHWANEYANSNSSSALRTAMNNLLSSNPALNDADSKAQFAAIMDRQKTIDPKGYADMARNVIDTGTGEAKQELQNHMRNNEDVAAKYGFKQFLKEDSMSTVATSQSMQDKQAGKDTKSLLAMDDDIIQSYAGLAGATGLDANQAAIVQNMTRAADDIIANPKMAEGLESKSLNTIASIASGGKINDWNAYKQMASNDMITISGQQFRRSKLPSTKNIDSVNGRVITYKDGSKYNADTGELTLKPGSNPTP